MSSDVEKKFEFDIDEYDSIDEDRIAIKKIRQGDVKACNELVKKYEKVVDGIARKFFVQGGDTSDLSQEGMMGLLNAVRSFDLSRTIPFNAFAKKCIERRVLTAVKNSTRQKHIPLNSSISLTQEAFGDSDDGRQVIDVIRIEAPDVAETVAAKETFSQIYEKMGTVLSPLEKNVFRYRLDGYSYEQMAKKLGTTEKAIDNAVQRIKGKVNKHIIGSDELER